MPSNLEKIIKHIGQAIASVRKEKRLSQEELGSMANSSQMTVQRLENGNGGTRIETLIAVTNALDMNFIDLLPKTNQLDSQNPAHSLVLDEITEIIAKLSVKKQKWLKEVIGLIIKQP